MDDSELAFKVSLNNKETELEEHQKGSQNYFNQSSMNEISVTKAQQNTRSSDAITINSSNYDLKKAGHPQACIFTFIFKIAAVLVYLFMSVLFSNIIIFILVIILTALDFWIVKNVTGRLLVGLRWTSIYKEDGTEEWAFQSHEGNRELNSVDSAFFWSAQISALLFWGILVFLNLISFSLYWFCLDCIVLTLTSTNFYGFYKCRGEHQKKMLGVKDQLTQKGINFIGNMMLKQKFGSNDQV